MTNQKIVDEPKNLNSSKPLNPNTSENKPEGEAKQYSSSQSSQNNQNGDRRVFRRGDSNRGGGRFGSRQGQNRDQRGLGDRKKFAGRGNGRRSRPEVQDNIENVVIDVRRVTKVVAGGKNMRFSALVVVGDRNGKIGFALAKGLDYQDSVNKAVRKAKDKMIDLKLNENKSISFPQIYKFKSCILYFKPAHSGTGLIAGGFLRPILELAGVENIYTKIIGSNNKVVGVRASIQALKKYIA